MKLYVFLHAQKQTDIHALLAVKMPWWNHPNTVIFDHVYTSIGNANDWNFSAHHMRLNVLYKLYIKVGNIAVLKNMNCCFVWYFVCVVLVWLIEKTSTIQVRVLSSTAAESVHTKIVAYPSGKLVNVSDVPKQLWCGYVIGSCRRERLIIKRVCNLLVIPLHFKTDILCV